MDEPTHAQESLFWDRVAEWLLDCPALATGPANWVPPLAGLPQKDQGPTGQ